MNLLQLTLAGALMLAAWCVLGGSAAESKAPAKKAAPQTPWSFLPLKESPLPKVRNDKWPQARVDHFLLAKMDKLHGRPPTSAFGTPLPP